MTSMGDALNRGMVLALSIWESSNQMLWLDGVYPVGADPTKPGLKRGPCAADSGIPSNLESQNGSSTVKYSNIKVGTIGSTNSQYNQATLAQ